MKSRVQKWGNSLAIRIPKPFAAEVGLNQDSDVEVSLRGGKLIVAPLAMPRYSLRELLSGVKPGNLHSEVQTGPRLGKEAW